MKESQSKAVENTGNKPKPKKLTNEDKEFEVIAEFASDGKDIFNARKKLWTRLDGTQMQKLQF
jgi:hypothetical protein